MIFLSAYTVSKPYKLKTRLSKNWFLSRLPWGPFMRREPLGHALVRSWIDTPVTRESTRYEREMGSDPHPPLPVRLARRLKGIA